MMPKSLLSLVCIAATATFFAGVCVAAPQSRTGDLQLLNAARQGDAEKVRSLIRQKIDVNQAQGDGMTALHWAAYNNDAEMAQLLIKAGANVKAVTRRESLTPLFMACTNGNPVLMDILLKAGSDANAANALGATALMQAAASGSVAAVQLLLDHKVDPNARESARGQTALMFAAALNRDAVIKMLAARGADLKVTSTVNRIEKQQFDEDGNPIPASAQSSRTGSGNVTLASFWRETRK